MDYGLWTMDYGLWTMDYGLWTMDYGLWTMDYGLWLPDYTLDPIILTKDAEAIDPGASLKKAFSRSKTTDTKSSYIFDHQENKINYEKNTKNNGFRWI